MYAENFKILIKNGKCNTMNKILCSLSKTIDMVKRPRLAKAICTCNAISLKISITFFTEIGKQPYNF